MKFWNTLRWIGALACVAVFIAAWLSLEPASSHDPNIEIRPAPVIVR
jgi:hypothetical protein